MCKSQMILASFDNFDYCVSCFFVFAGPGGDMQWCFSQVKGAIDDDVAEGMSSDMLTDGCEKKMPSVKLNLGKKLMCHSAID